MDKNCKNCGVYQEILSKVHKVHLYSVQKIVKQKCLLCSDGKFSFCVVSRWVPREGDNR